MPIRRLTAAGLSLFAALGCITLEGSAQDARLQIPRVLDASTGALTACAPPQRSAADNGISVGDPKIFDNRSLALMLDTLNESLRSVQAVDGRSITSNFSSLQGFQQESVARAFSLQGAPLPGVTDTLKLTGQSVIGSNDTANQTTATNPKNETTGSTSVDTSNTTTGLERSTQTTTAARSPVTPELPTTLTAPAFTPQFGQSPADLLSDQINLTYQIFNVRMMLERALTDRVINGKPRLQAVLGFNVSINPPRDSQDSAAIVEVTVQPRDAKDSVSVVALMPVEKTYNSAALSNRSTAFGGSAVSSIIGVGYNERRQSQTFYLFRDNDTIAYQRMDGEQGSVATKFGWAFRPVLGRRSTSPGTRQMLAVISLPNEDAQDPAEVALEVSVKTHWQHFDRDTLTTGSARTFWQRLARGASLATVQDRPPRTIATTETCVMVANTIKGQQDLGPEVTQLRWQLSDNNTAVVTALGKNFFQGTAIRIGAKTFATAADGFTIKSDRTFDLVAPVSDLLGTAVVVGRYGNAIELLRPDAGVGGMEIGRATIEPPLGGRRRVEIQLTGPKGSSLPLANVPLPLVVSLGNTVVPRPYNYSDRGGLTYVEFFVPTDMAPTGEGLLTVQAPFAGEQWRRTYRVYDPTLAFSVLRLASESVGTGDAKKDYTKLFIVANDPENGFSMDCAAGGIVSTVALGGDLPIRPLPINAPVGAWRRSPVQVEMRVESAVLEKNPFLLVECGGTVHRLAMPAAPAAAPVKTALSKIEPSVVKVNSAGKVTIEGTALSRVTMVTANGVLLASRVDNDKMEVFLERSLTKEAGDVTLVARDDKGAILGSIDFTIGSK